MKGEPVVGYQSGAHPIYGSWGRGFGGETKTPDSEGYTRKACFGTDHAFAFYKADTVAYEGTFTLAHDDSTQAVLVEITTDSTTTVHYEPRSDRWLMDQVVTFAGADTLILADQCYDCYVSVYTRVE